MTGKKSIIKWFIFIVFVLLIDQMLFWFSCTIVITVVAPARDDFVENPAIYGKHMTKAMSIGTHTGSSSIDLPVTQLRNLLFLCNLHWIQLSLGFPPWKYHIWEVLVFSFIRGSCHSLPSTQRLSIKCGPTEAALWRFDSIIERTWARGLDRKTSSNRERASSIPSFDDDAAKKSLSMNDLLRWKVLPTPIGSREGWTKRCIL